MATTQIKDGYNGGSDNQLKVNADGSINVDITGGGGGTSNTNLVEVGGAPFSLGQQTASASLPVVLTAAQLTTLTPLSTVTVTQSSGANLHVDVDNFPATQTVNGSVSVSNFPATQPVSGTVAVSSLPSIPAGSNAIGSVSVSNFPTTQAVSGTVTANAGSGTFQTNVTNSSLTIVQPTASNLNATVTGSVSVSNFPATQPVSGTVAVSSLPSIPAGSNAIGSVSVSNFPTTQPVSGTVAVSNFPTTQGVNLTQVGGSAFALGQQLAAASLPVVLTASQLTTLTPLSTVTVTQSSGANLHVNVDNFPSSQNVVVTSSALPTGAATAANQATQITAEQAIQTSTATIATNTTGVSTAANQTSQLAQETTTATNTTSILANQTNGNQKTQVTSSALPTGAATAANQTAVFGTPGSAAPTSTLLVGGSDGTNLRTNKVDVNGSQYAVLTGPLGAAQGLAATATAFNQLRVYTDPTDLMHDKFNSPTTIDTTYRWNTPVTSGTGSITENSGLIFSPATTANGYIYINSVSSFGQSANTTLSFAFELYLETSIATGYSRFWGLASQPASPTATAPLTDAVGFLLNSSGVLSAVIYQGGTQVFSQTIAVPTDGLLHRYSVQWRTDKAAFYLDSSDSYSALSQRITPNVTFLPVLMQMLTTSSTSGTPVFKFRQAAVSDNGRNNTALSDGTYGFIKGTIKQASIAAASTDTSLVVGLSPNSPLPTGTNSIGTVTANQGTANTLANAWAQKITDGTNGPAAVKAASTTVAATDPALVVTISPNGGLTNTIGVVAQGNPAGVGNAWPIKVTDGTNTAPVKAASTAAAATDPALVVSISPNSTANVSTKTNLVYSAPQTATVNTTSTVILAANSARLGLYLSNTSGQMISLAFNGQTATYQYGITLFPGEKFYMDEYSFTTGAVSAVTTGSTTYIGIQEIT